MKGSVGDQLRIADVLWAEGILDIFVYLMEDGGELGWHCGCEGEGEGEGNVDQGETFETDQKVLLRARGASVGTYLAGQTEEIAFYAMAYNILAGS